jgi:hypothetical protein|tara:strand:+ start:20586 stop:20765 length:180 start_codon:yes stop_codon:yes gene_type:complete
MKYKNVTKDVLKFRAYNTKMEKVVFVIEPGKEIKLGKEMKLGGMERVPEKAKKNSGGKE